MQVYYVKIVFMYSVSSSVPMSVPAVDTLYAEIAPNATSGLTTISVPSTKVSGINFYFLS